MPRDVEDVLRAIHASPVFDNPRVHLAKGERWAVRLSQAPCALPLADAGLDARPPVDAGSLHDAAAPN
jgi:hypothetical protein